MTRFVCVCVLAQGFTRHFDMQWHGLHTIPVTRIHIRFYTHVPQWELQYTYDLWLNQKICGGAWPGLLSSPYTLVGKSANFFHTVLMINNSK